MEKQKMDLANIQGKLSRAEMKNLTGAVVNHPLIAAGRLAEALFIAT
jgi:hypothetical protein